ncbi:MAG: DUF1343 domain-containing protein, partial [Candidatus Methanomethylicota archaeon]
ALLINDKYNFNTELKVISMENWRREYWFENTGLEWVNPSPNMPTPKTAIIYPGTALIEGTNISEGRGTTRPFELIGAPWIKAKELAKQLNMQGLSGVTFRPAYFKPYSSKYAGKICRGIQVHITDKNEFRAFEVGVHILSAIKKLYPNNFEWIKIKDKYFIDQLAGTDKLRKMIDGNEDPWNITFELEKDLEKFAIEREKFIIYT